MTSQDRIARRLHQAGITPMQYRIDTAYTLLTHYGRRLGDAVYAACVGDAGVTNEQLDALDRQPALDRD